MRLEEVETAQRQEQRWAEAIDAARAREQRWSEDERRALSVTYSDERPDYPFWVSVIGMVCVVALLLASIYLIAAGMGL